MSNKKNATLATSETDKLDTHVSIFRSLRTTLLVLFLALFLSISLLPLLAVSILVVQKTESTLDNNMIDKLTAVRNIKAGQITDYINERLTDIKSLSHNPFTIDAANEFEQALNTLLEQNNTHNKTDVMTTLRQLYLGKPNLMQADHEDIYSPIHKKYHEVFSSYQQTHDYYDFFIIEPHRGLIIYTVFKEDDFGTSLTTGKYADSNLAHVYKKVLAKQSRDYVALEDFAAYAPSKNQAAAFVASGIFDGETLVGVLVFQLSTAEISRIMQERTGMGETGETILVSSDDFLLRSNSRFVDGESILVQKVDTEATRASAAGQTGVKVISDYRGKTTIIAHMPLAIPDVRWSLNAKVDKEEVHELAYELSFIMLILVPLCILIVVALALIFSNSIAQPIIKTTDIVKKIAAGDMSQEITTKSKNEIGVMMHAFHLLTQNIQHILINSGVYLEQLAEGKVKTYISGEFPGDFKQLKYALEKTAKKLTETTASNERQNWIKTGHARLNEALSGEKNIDALSKITIDFLVTYLDLQIGLFYILRQPNEDENEGEKASYLELIATYGYVQPQNKTIPHFHNGEGLVGQVMLERQPIERAHTAQEYLYIVQSGLAQAVPKYVYITPFLYENNLKGVIELGNANEFTELQKEFLKQSMANIGIAINTAESRTQMQVLLEKSQSQAETLRKQQAIMQQANEELQAQAEEMQSQQEELRQTNEELEERGRQMQAQQEAVNKKNAELETARQAIQTKAEELEMASKYKSEFLANMSHELRTPLNSLLILAQLLTENKEQNLNDKQIQCAQTIHSSGTDLLNLINEILDLSKVEAGKIEIQPQKVALAELVQILKQRFNHVAEEKSLYFNINLADNLPDAILTDPQRLQQIINNLLSNAFKFTDQGGVSLEIRRPHPTETLHNDNLPSNTIVISVCDTGIGIAEDKQKVVFEAFQQADGTTSRKYGGTGLGLSISRRLIQLMQGEIQLRSEPNQGSCFIIFLPESVDNSIVTSSPLSLSTPVIPTSLSTQSFPTSPSVTPQTSLPSLPDDRNTLQQSDTALLIIEDDLTFARVLMDLAKEKNLQCLHAADGMNGLQLAEEYQPKAIMLDIGLPQMDGWSVMEKLKDNPNTRHIPIHIVSGHAQHREARQMGAIGYVLKPANMTELGEAFNKITYFIHKNIKNLLLVTDNEKHCVYIQDIIGSPQIKIDVANSCDDAWRKLNVASYECIILDFAVDQRNGVNLLAQLCTDDKLEQIPVIIYSENELTETEEATLRPYTNQLTLKAVQSPERLVDEATLFLHEVESQLPEKQQAILKIMHNKEAALEGKKILLVDDDGRNLFALAAVLEGKGMDVVMAANGKNALQSLEENVNIDVVLMDIMMPEMDGYEAIRKIRERPQYRKLPIIALTAKAMKDDANKCIEAGASDYLSKPVDTNKLLSLMRVWLYR